MMMMMFSSRGYLPFAMTVIVVVALLQLPVVVVTGLPVQYVLAHRYEECLYDILKQGCVYYILSIIIGVYICCCCCCCLIIVCQVFFSCNEKKEKQRRRFFLMLFLVVVVVVVGGRGYIKSSLSHIFCCGSLTHAT